MARIFISYRRDDTGGYAGWLNTLLSQRFERDEIFMDLDSIEPGVDFTRVIENSLAEVDAVIAMIGPHWLSVTDQRGRRRLRHVRDWVRLELAAALARDIHVIPALVGATMPPERELPPPLRPLCKRQAVELRPSRFRHDVEHLAAVLTRILGRGNAGGRDASAEQDAVLKHLYALVTDAVQHDEWSEASRLLARVVAADPAYRDAALLLHAVRAAGRLTADARSPGAAAEAPPVDPPLLARAVGNSDLLLRVRDITTIQADALVTSDDLYLSMTGGVSAAIAWAAGPSVRAEAAKLSPIKLGEVAVTSAGSLAARYVFHAAVLDPFKPVGTDVGVIRAATRRCLELCQERGLRSMALPALATGTARLSPEQSAVAMMLEITSFLSDPRVEMTVTIALHGAGHGTDRYYQRVSEFLETAERADRLTSALARLEPDERAAGKREGTVRETLAKRRSRWEDEMVRTLPAQPECAAPAVPAYRDELHQDLNLALSAAQAKVAAPDREATTGSWQGRRQEEAAAIHELILLRRRELMDRRLALLREGRTLRDDPAVEAEEQRLHELEAMLRGNE